MEALLLARLQFAVTVGFPWLFLFLTMGLAATAEGGHIGRTTRRRPPVA